MHERISIDPMVCHGQAYVKGTRIPVRTLRFTFYVFPIFFLVAILLSAASAQSSSPIVINELQYNPASGDHGEEYVELYNAGTETVDLTGAYFSDGVLYTFPTGTLALPGGYLVVANDPAAVEARYGITGVLGPLKTASSPTAASAWLWKTRAAFCWTR